MNIAPDSSDSLKNIQPRSFRSLSGLEFFVPSYQRGYRWTAKEAEKMLDDFKSFCLRIQTKKTAAGEFYCMQPIVVRKRKGKEYYEVIDGQQRLTTLYILVKCIEDVCLMLDPSFRLYSISYETRAQHSQDFLKSIGSDEPLEKANDYVDFYYMNEVYRTMRDWMTANPTYNFKIAQALMQQTYEDHAEIGNNIQIIWYEVGDDASPIDIFTRLNIGKIPLTNAELVKALLLHRINMDQDEPTPQQLRISAEWNMIEQKLQNDSFWYFLYQKDSPFRYDNRIDFIFDVMKARQEADSDVYHTFYKFSEDMKKLEENAAYPTAQSRVASIWQEIKDVFQTLEEWYEDQELYHYIGYLIECGCDIPRMIEASGRLDKDEFARGYLEGEIRHTLAGIDLDKLEYSDSKAVRKVLLLFNILTVLRSKKSDMRFPFNRFKQEDWHIEHVCSRTDKSIKSERQMREWLEDMQEFFGEGEGDIITRVRELAAREQGSRDLPDEFATLFDDVQRYFCEDDASLDNKDSLCNLTLLDAATNTGYGNSFFPVKRKRIIKNDKQGIFVPIATKNLFLKYYSPKGNDLMYWRKDDAASYLAAMKEVLGSFLTIK